MSGKYRRYFMKEKKARILLAEASRRLNYDLSRILKDKTSIEVVTHGSIEVFLIDGRPVLARADGSLFPTLLFSEFLAAAPKAVVDMGAVPYVCKGANVMAPGIRSLEGEFSKGGYVFVIDEKHGKALAVGEALYDDVEARKARQGVVFKNVHHVSDETWSVMKSLTL